jgi:hypothetical protein
MTDARDLRIGTPARVPHARCDCPPGMHCACAALQHPCAQRAVAREPSRATGGRSRAIARTRTAVFAHRARSTKRVPRTIPIPSPTGAWWKMAGRRKEMKVTLHLQPPTWGMPTCHPDFLQVASGVHVVLVVRQHARLLARFLNRLWPAARPPTGARKLLTECGLAGADVLQGRRSQRQPTKGLASPEREREREFSRTVSPAAPTRRELPARD